MKFLMDTVKHFLRKRGVGFALMEDAPILCLHFRGDNASFDTFITVGERRRCLEVETLTLDVIPPSRREPVAQLLMEANSAAVVGAFVMEPATGRIRYRTSILLGGMKPEDRALTHLLFSTLYMFDFYLPAIRAVVAGTSTPKSALTQLKAELKASTGDAEARAKQPKTGRPTESSSNPFSHSSDGLCN